MQNQIQKNFFDNLCRNEYRKTFSVIYAEPNTEKSGCFRIGGTNSVRYILQQKNLM
jgi:hypothetical protein